MSEQPDGIVYRRPPLYAKQREAMFDPRRITLIEAIDQVSGKTVSGIIWLYEQALKGKPGQHFWWVAPVSMQARIAFNRMKQHFQDQDGRPMFTVNLTDHTLTNARGAVIAFRSGDHPDTLYGEDVYAAVIDEASRFKEESWHAIRSTLDGDAGSDPDHRQREGPEELVLPARAQAEQGMPNFGYHKLTAADAVEAGVLAQEEIDSARAMLPEHVFQELYYAEPSDDEGNPFGAQHVRSVLCAIERAACGGVGLGLGTQDGLDGWHWARCGRAVCEALRFQKPWHEQVDIIKKVGRQHAGAWWTRRVLAIRSSRRSSCRRSASTGRNVIELSCPRLEGYKFTMASKQMLMEGLALAIHERKVTFPEGPISMELMNFEYEFTRLGIRYSAPPGMHDDCVCALALAWRCFDDRTRAYDQNLDWIGDTA